MVLAYILLLATGYNSAHLESDSTILGRFVDNSAISSTEIAAPYGSEDTYITEYFTDMYVYGFRDGVCVYENTIIPWQVNMEKKYGLDCNLSYFLSPYHDVPNNTNVNVSVIDYSPSLLDFSCMAHSMTNASQIHRWDFRISSRGYTSRQFSEVIGKDLYRLIPQKLDVASRNSITAAYESYFERLYYVSVGDKDWSTEEESEWGTPDAGSSFPFNLINTYAVINSYFDLQYPTNYGCRCIPPTRKLQEAQNVYELRKKLTTSMFGDCVVATRGGTPVFDSPDILYRPKWILDASDYPNTDGSSYFWWASTAPLPQIEQNGEMPSSEVACPIFPEFTWTHDPIYTWTYYGEIELTKNWPLYGVALCHANADYTTHPAQILFDAVGCHQDTSKIKCFNFGDRGLITYCTNTYPLCSMRYAKDLLSLDEYVHESWGIDDNDEIALLRPTHLVAVNQILGLMDRTYQIPDMKIASTNKKTVVKVEANIISDVRLDATIRLEPYERKYYIENAAEIGDIDMWASGYETETRTYGGLSSGDGIYCHLEGVNNNLSLTKPSIAGNPYAWITEKTLAEISTPGHHVFELFQVLSGQPGFPEGFVLVGKMDGSAPDNFLTYADINTLTISFWPSGYIERRYEYEFPDSVTTAISRTIPSANIPDSSVVDSRDIAILSRLDYTFTSDGSTITNMVYESDVASASTIGYPTDDIAGYVFGVSDSVKGYMKYLCDGDFEDPSSFADIPSSFSVECSVLPYATINYLYPVAIGEDKIFLTREYTNEYWEAWFDATNVVEKKYYVVTNLHDVVSYSTMQYDDFIYPDGRTEHYEYEVQGGQDESYNYMTNYLAWRDERYETPYEAGPYIFRNKDGSMLIEREDVERDNDFVLRDREVETKSIVPIYTTYWMDDHYQIISNKVEFGPVYEEKVRDDVTPGSDSMTEYFSISNLVTLADAVRTNHVVETQSVRSFIRYDYTDDGIIEAKNVDAKHVFVNPYTQEEEYEDGGMPLNIGEYMFTGADLPITYNTDDIGGFKGEFKGHANTKALVDVKWKWNGLERTDKGE